MDIIFQSGDFYSSASDSTSLLQQIGVSLIGSLAGAIVGAYVTWSVFLRTIKENRNLEITKQNIEREKEIKKSNNFDEDKLKYLAGTLNSIVASSRHQIFHLEIANKDLSQGIRKNPVMSSVTGYNLERIVNKSNNEDYYHAFIRINPNESADDFHIIFSSLEFLYDSNLRINSYFKKFEQEIIINIMSSYTSHMGDLYKSISALLFRLKKASKIGLHNDLSSIHNTYIDKVEKNSDLKKEVKDLYLYPILEFMDHPDLYEYPETIEIMNKVRSTLHLLVTADSQIKRYAVILSNLSNKMDKVLTRLETSSTILNKYGFTGKDLIADLNTGNIQSD